MGFHSLSRALILVFMDELLKTGLEFPNLANIVYPVNNDFDNSTLSQIETGEYTQYYKTIFLSFIKIIVSCLTFCLLSCLFVLPERFVYLVYFRVVSVCIGTISYWLNMQTLKDIYELHFTEHFLYFLFLNLIIQCGLSLAFNYLQDPTTNQSIYKVFSFSFTIPTLVTFLASTWTYRFLNTVAVLSTLLPLFIMLKTFRLDLFIITHLIRYQYIYIRAVQNIIITRYRLFNSLLDLISNVFEFLVVNWNYFKMSSVLRIFWAIRVLIQIPYLITAMEIQNETLFRVAKNLLVEGCDTFIAVLGMTSYISYLCRYIEAFFQWVLLTDNLVDRRIETDFALSFYILAMQSELTCSDPEKRFITFYRNISLICFSLLHYIHTYVVDPLLISLNNSCSSSFNRHIRALLVCGFFIVCPINMWQYLWSHHSVNTWLLAISLFNITIVLKVGSSLFRYCLFLIDAYYTFWEELEYYVYFIESFSITVEFCYNIFLFLNGAYAIAFVSCGIFQTFVKCIYLSFHAYSFIWCEAKNGWNVFIKRRTAVNKVKSLSDATMVELGKLNDICAICRGNMVSAKITRCNHYFHGVCLLRKLLYINDQDRCPLCKSEMFRTEM